MELDPVILSRIQFGFVISFHIIFPAFTMGLAAWLATIEGMRLFTGNMLYRRVFDFWLKVFAVISTLSDYDKINSFGEVCDGTRATAYLHPADLMLWYEI